MRERPNGRTDSFASSGSMKEMRLGQDQSVQPVRNIGARLPIHGGVGAVISRSARRVS